MKWSSRTILASGFFCIFSFCKLTVLPASADGSEASCASAFQPDTVQFSKDTRLHVAYLDSISEHKYNEAKKNGSLSVVVPIEDLPVKIGADYGEFQKNLDDYKRSVNYTLNQDDSIRYYSSHMPTANVYAFVECLRTHSKGLFLSLERPVDETGNLALRLEWNPPAGANKKIEISIDPVVNGTISGLKPKFIDPDSDIRFDVTRTTKDQPVSVTVNGNLVGGGSYSDALYDPGVPPLLPTYHYVTSEWHDMKFPWSKALPDTTPDEVCKEVTSEGAWSCHAYTCPKSCDKDVGGRSVNHNVESSGPFDGPPDYGDNTGQCRYTFICTHN